MLWTVKLLCLHELEFLFEQEKIWLLRNVSYTNDLSTGWFQEQIRARFS